MTNVANGNSATRYLAYDALGRVASTQQITSSETYGLSYVYNLAGALTSETYPSGRVVTTGYDGANRVNTITGNLGGQQTPYASGITYAPHGAATFVGYGNQVARNFTYTNRLLLNSYQDQFQNSTSSALFSVQENWGTTSTNNNGNVSSETIAQGGPAPLASLPQTTRSYSYDTLNRLSLASDSAGWSRQLSYDEWGNIWVAANSGVTLAGNTPTANVYNSNNHIATSRYDNAGNLLSVNGFTLAYDAENRQISATEQPNLGSVQEFYLYDGNGQRVEKIAPAGNTIYVFDAFGQLTAEYNNFPTSPACTTCYLSTDRLGSVRLVTDQSGTPVTRHDYLPFGEEIPVTSASNDVEQRFTGQIRDTETGMDFFNARYFTASLARFNSVDPANAGADPADPQTWNGYSYVRNSPTALTDLSGLDPDGPTVTAPAQSVTVTATVDPVATGDPGALGTVGSGGSTNGGSVRIVSYFQGQAPQPVYVPFFGTMTSANIIFHPPQAGDFDPSANSDALEGYAQALILVGQNVDAQKAFIMKFALATGAVGSGGAAFTTLTGISSVSGLTTITSGGEALGTAGLESGQVTLVSRWGAQGLNAGNWVMRGGAGVVGYILSGKWQPGFGNQFAPFTSGQSYLVPTSALQNPGWAEYGLGWVKGLLGQAIYRP